MFLLINRKNIIIDNLSEVRYIKLQSANNIVVACAEDEAIGVIGSDCNTHYPLIKTDTTSAENAVSIVEVSELPDNFAVNNFMINAEGEIVRRFTIEEYQNLKQTVNKTQFALFLEQNPIEWIDGKLYGCTQQDQSEIALNLTQYEIAQVAGVETPILEWHAKGEENVAWTYEELSKLNVAITEFVYPYFHQMQQYKTAIKTAETYEGIDAIEISYVK